MREFTKYLFRKLGRGKSSRVLPSSKPFPLRYVLPFAPFGVSANPASHHSPNQEDPDVKAIENSIELDALLAEEEYYE